MKNYETKSCCVCREPSNSRIGTGHYLKGKIVVLATFCSDRCYRRAGPSDRAGCFGKWRGWMGLTEAT